MTHTRSQPIRLVLVEDQELRRVAIQTILNNTGFIQVIAETPSGDVILRNAQAWKPDVVLMDIFLRDGNSLDICREIHAACPSTHILFFSAFCDQTVVQDAIQAGASGFIDKTASTTHLVDAIQTVAAGSSYFGGSAMEMIRQILQFPSAQSEPSPIAYLSPQEGRIIALIAEGHTNKEIADLLNLSKTAVQHCISDAVQKLNVTSRSQAVITYQQGRRNPKP